MPVNIIYTIKKEDETASNSDQIGRIVFFDKYSTTSAFFPYFYLGENSQILKYENWPQLVPYLYDKKLNLYIIKNGIGFNVNIFNVYSFSLNQDKILTLNFTDMNSLKALGALKEDRDSHYLENNNSYDNWNRTFTLLNDLKFNNQIILNKDKTYYINDISVSNTIASISIKTYLSISKIDALVVNDISVEFGLYRIPNNNEYQSVIYSALKGKYFSFNDLNSLVNGLRTRSTISGHYHEHTHDMSHTHDMQHTHNLNNHTHSISHNHTYQDTRTGDISSISIVNGWQYSINLNNNNFIQTLLTNQSNKLLTDGPNLILTEKNNGQTSPPVVNITSDVEQTTTDINTQFLNNQNFFKVDKRNFAETYTVFAYLYGGKYNP